MTSAEFCELLKGHGVDFFTGVPCSLLKGIINILEQDPDVAYVPAVREDVAVGLAVGAYLGGRHPMVLMQNSGLGTCLNALTSLAIIYEIPLLLLITWRGDAPQHRVMGKITTLLLDAVGVPHHTLHQGGTELALCMAHGGPAALVLHRGVLS